MTENVRKVFDILGVEPNERFKFNISYDISNRFFFFDNHLTGYTYFDENEVVKCDWLLQYCLTNTDKIIKIRNKKHVGDLICEEMSSCVNCPLDGVKCGGCDWITLYEKLESFKKIYNDKEIYDICKKRLDEEVEE